MKSIGRIALAVCAAVLLMAAVGYFCWPRFVEHPVDYKMAGNPQPKIAAAQAAAIERRERVIEQTVWRKEMEAQVYGKVFEDFWDAVNGASNRWDVVEGLKFREVVWGERGFKESLGLGIERWVAKKKSEPPSVDVYEEWRERARGWRNAGWEIMQCEFRHNAFDPQTNDVPARSKFYFSAHLTNAAPARAVVEGNLFVEWRLRATNEPPSIYRIDASNLSLLTRAGGPAFIPVLTEIMEPPRWNGSIEPIMAADLDGDSVVEIVVSGKNRVYRRRGGGYTVESFCKYPPNQILGGLIADFSGDGVLDFLYANHDGLFVIDGSPGGVFDSKPRKVAANVDEFDSPRSLTCGDIDGDGDLDLFIGQYQGPFGEGRMPAPYYDANDGYPSWLLLNDGHGFFTDVTYDAGLTAHRRRRIYAASLVDLNGDANLDLLVTSDFAGVDVYLNDGRGHFEEVTRRVLNERRLFGMGHAIADFNGDGLLDFFVSGMTSATASRLDHLNMNRSMTRLDPAMRRKMNEGSRLYLQNAGGRFNDTAGPLGVAQTGWSWGVAAADFDNDGWVDLYVGNGMESRRTVHDYESEFWRHDIYVGNSENNEAAAIYFMSKGDRTRGAGDSYGGFEKNRLFLNLGKGFVDVAHPLGVAWEQDCRNVIAADLNNDGAMDLIVTALESAPPFRNHLYVAENRLEQRGNWIGIQLRDEKKLPCEGASVTIETSRGKMMGTIATGDSFRSQSPSVVHFGLGGETNVASVEIKWPGGRAKQWRNPGVNRYLEVGQAPR